MHGLLPLFERRTPLPEAIASIRMARKVALRPVGGHNHPPAMKKN
jgi:hypothetical protein